MSVLRKGSDVAREAAGTSQGQQGMTFPSLAGGLGGPGLKQFESEVEKIVGAARVSVDREDSGSAHTYNVSRP
jgi:hypothetical protein